MPQIRIFNGGLRTAVAAHLIKDNESVINLNVNHIQGILIPIKDKVSSVGSAQKFGHFFTINSTWYWSATPKDWVEFQERLYIGSRSGASTKILGGTEYTMGIEAPTVLPTGVASAETPEQDQITRLDLDAETNAAADIPADVTLRYKVVNIDSGGDFYPSDTTFTIRVVSALDSGHADYDKNRIVVLCEDTNIDTTIAIFRFFDNYWRKIYEGVGSVTVNDDTYDISANNVITDYENEGLDGTYQYALTWYNSVDGTESVPIISDEIEVSNGLITVSNLEVATNTQVDKKRLYRIGGAITTFTLVIELPNATVLYADSLADDAIEGSLLSSQTNFQPVDDLEWMMEANAMLFAADGDKLRFTPIGEPDYWPQTYFLDFPRPITGLAKTPIGILVFNQYETWLVTGTGPLSLAQQPLTGSQGCVNGDSVVNIEGAAYWASTDGVCVSDGGRVKVMTREKLDKIDLSASINAVVYDDQYYLLKAEQGNALILDLERQSIREADYDIDSFIVANDILYGHDAGALHALEADTLNLTFTYKTPEYIGNSLTIYKVYKNIYVSGVGGLTVKVYVDDILVVTDVLAGTDNHQIKVPNEDSKGFKIQFEISGTGTVNEIAWEDGNANQ